MRVLILIISFFGLAELICLGGNAPTMRTDRWETFPLWSNAVLSASLKYLPEASLADEDYLYEEFDNHTHAPLDVLQAWLGLPGTRTDQQTHKSVLMGDMTGGVVYHGLLPPGKTTTAGAYIFECGMANLGLPPKQGFHVELTPNGDVQLTDGTRFTSSNNAKLIFEWRYPNASEIESLKSRFKKLLAAPDNQFASGYYLEALAQMPEVYSQATPDELLAALKSHSWVDGKAGLMEIVGKRFPDDPRLLAYFVDQLSRPDGDAFYSFPREVWPNPIFIEPLVARYERTGREVEELQQQRTEWMTNRQVMARLTAAFLKWHPIVKQKVTTLSGEDLCAWSSAVVDAGIIGNTNFLTWLEPALDDRRNIPDCLSKYDLRPRLPWTPRVCDSALGAILMILDGDTSPAFKKAGIKGWRTQKQAHAANDRVISDLKKRLNLPDTDGAN